MLPASIVGTNNGSYKFSVFLLWTTKKLNSKPLLSINI